METFLSILPTAFIVIAVINLILAIIHIIDGQVGNGIWSIVFMIFGIVFSRLLGNPDIPKWIILVVDIVFVIFAFIGLKHQLEHGLNEGLGWTGGILNLVVFVLTIVSALSAVIGSILSVLAVVVAVLLGGGSSEILEDNSQ